jgi:predicted transcriptional regulator of viral defense system
MRISSFEKAKEDVIAFFDIHPYLAHTTYDLREIFEENRNNWGIAKSKNIYDFYKFLEDKNILIKEKLTNEHTGSEKTIYRNHNATEFDIGLTIKKDGYLSNYSAMKVHQLTLQLPKTVYVSIDKYKESVPPKTIKLQQENIDKAFSKKQRLSTESYKSHYNGYKYVFLHKKHGSINIGIHNNKKHQVTDLERTLIDIAIRPAYSGGVFQILEAYKTAKDKVNTNKIAKYIDEFNYIYPYHQLVGFLMDMAGYDNKLLEPFLKKKTALNFYQTYNMNNKKLNEKWGIYYPMGLEAL